jgi:hypothetical protein
MSDRLTFTADQERCLRSQSISSTEPGTILHDFDAVLDFVGPEGVAAQGKYNLLPIKSIGELDRRLSRPLNLEMTMKRPLMRSHPYLLGLNLLLRASGLTRVEGTGAKARLVQDPEMVVQWKALNPTERYFDLLEAWLRFGRPEMVGETGGLWDHFLFKCLQLWQALPRQGKRFDIERPLEIYVPGLYREFYVLALMDLFGFLEVEYPSRPIMPWGPAAVRHLPFGDAMCTLMASRLPTVWTDFLPREDADEEDEEPEDHEHDEEEDEAQMPRFGEWQPVFQPYFPEWRENLVLPEIEPREGTFVFRVSLGKVWRLIAMPADSTLEDLARWVLRSVNFDNDHLYEFTYHNRLGATEEAHHPYMDEGPYTDEVEVGSLPLEPGQTMKFHFDFGDDWMFDVKLERIEPPGSKIKAPHIMEKHGKSPEQYPRWDD